MPHIHAVVCRVDRDGRINNSHEIMQRSHNAADAVAIKRGWQKAVDKGEENKKMLLKTCHGILAAMPRWDWDIYQSALESKGYTVNVNRDSDDIMRGYSIKMGNSKYTSSKIHHSIKPSEIESTWRKLRSTELEERAKAMSKQKAEAEALRRSQAQASKKPQGEGAQRPQTLTAAKPSEAPFTRIVSPCAQYDLKIGDRLLTRYIPMNLHNVFREGLDSSIENAREITHMACALFLELVVPPHAYPGGGGGGGSNDQSPWGRDPREDEIAWAKRCSEMARHLVPARKKLPTKSRGFHR